MQEKINGSKTEVPALGQDIFNKFFNHTRFTENLSKLKAWHGSDDLKVIPVYPVFYDQLGLSVYYDKKKC